MPVLKQFIQKIQGLPTHSKGVVRQPAIITEAFLLTGLALFIVSRIGSEATGFFGLFLAAASLVHRFQRVLKTNKDQIFVQKIAPRSANLETSLSILMMFIGMCFAFLLAAMLFQQNDLETFFGFIYDNTNSQSGTLLTRNFGVFTPILINNCMVMLTTGILCLLYRSYGALLSLGWNAAVWIIVLYSLTSRLFSDALQDNIMVSIWAILAVTPHLIIEGVSYIIIAIAAIFYSKGLTRYMLPLPERNPASDASVLAMELPKENLFYEISVTCMKMVLMATTLTLIGAFVESTYAPWVLGQLNQWLHP